MGDGQRTARRGQETIKRNKGQRGKLGVIAAPNAIPRVITRQELRTTPPQLRIERRDQLRFGVKLPVLIIKTSANRNGRSD